jgi:hypothetical protein
MIVYQLIQFSTVNIFLFLFSFLSEQIPLVILHGSLRLKMLLLKVKLLNLGFVNLLDEVRLSLCIIDSLFSSFFFFCQFNDSCFYLSLLMRLDFQLNLCFHSFRLILKVHTVCGYTFPKGVTSVDV